MCARAYATRERDYGSEATLGLYEFRSIYECVPHHECTHQWIRFCIIDQEYHLSVKV